MNKYQLFVPFLLFLASCTTAPVTSDVANTSELHETLFIYEDGRMELNARYVDVEDVVIYPDGRGGEKAAVRVHFPLHSSFYRDSIVVLRVERKFDDAIGKR